MIEMTSQELQGSRINAGGVHLPESFKQASHQTSWSGPGKMPARCTRCKEPAVLSSPDARCIPCFKTYLQKSFKTSIGRLGAGGRPTTLAIALSGGYNSTALALLFAYYLTTLNPHPHAPPPRIVILHATDAHPQTIVHMLAEILPGSLIVPVPKSIDLAGVKDATDAASLRRALMFQSLVEAAEDNGCDKLLLGTSATRAAADILHATVTARGTLVRDAAVARLKTGNVDVIRPLRDIPSRQLVRYAMLELPNAEFVDGAVNVKMGLYDIVNRFVGEVGVDNSASVHNVVRTAGRLLEVVGSGCDICGASVVDSCCEGSCGGNEGDCSNTERLCVGCRDCVKRDANIARVVDNVLTDRRRRKAREEMRAAIEEFIL